MRNTLKECIKSVLKQTYEYWEMIIVDDASMDNAALSYRNYSIVAPNGKVVDNIQIKRLFKDYKPLLNDLVDSIFGMLSSYLKNRFTKPSKKLKRE